MTDQRIRFADKVKNSDESHMVNWGFRKAALAVKKIIKSKNNNS